MDPDSQPERLYAGEFRHSIDNKNRITIPLAGDAVALKNSSFCLRRLINFSSLCRRQSLGKRVRLRKQIKQFPRVIAAFSCANCIPALSMQARTGKVGSYCRKSFAE